MIIDWHGYGLGAVTADTIGLKVFQKGGSTYAIFQTIGDRNSVSFANVHPRVKACGMDDERIEHKAGAFPIRWYLDTTEIMDIIKP